MRWQVVRVVRYAAFESRVGGTSKAVECKEGWMGVRERVGKSLRVLEEGLKVSGRRTREAMLLLPPESREVEADAETSSTTLSFLLSLCSLYTQRRPLVAVI
jgi:hypothetical protein